MKSFRRLAVGVAGLSLALAGGATVWLAGTDATAAPVGSSAPGQQPFGGDILIESQVDPNFCVKDVASPANPASEASMSQCEPEPAQHWTLAHSAGGSVVIIGGATGRCLDFSANAPAYVTMANCTFSTAEHFYFTPKGQLESTSGTKCLEPTQAAQDAELQIVTCQKQKVQPLQFWKLAQ